MAIAERNRPKTVADILHEGEEGLLKNTDVQMSLLKQDSELSSVFKALVIEGKQITAEQFWRARIVPSPRSPKLTTLLSVGCWVLTVAFTTDTCY